MNIPIPQEFRVGALRWDVLMVPAKDLQGDCGDADRALQTIRINEDLSDEMKEATFIHELIHVLEIDMDHSHVETMSVLLHQILKQL
jgi:hypothetical protein